MPSPDFTATAPDNHGLPADEAISCSIWISGPDGVAPPLNETTLEERSDPAWAGNLHPEDAGTVLARWERCNDAGLPWRCNYRIRDADGGYRTIASRGIPVRDAAGRIVLWAGVDLDVTVRDEPCWQAREFCTLSAVARAIEGSADAGEAFRETAALLPRGFRHPEQVSRLCRPLVPPCLGGGAREDLPRRTGRGGRGRVPPQRRVGGVPRTERVSDRGRRPRVGVQIVGRDVSDRARYEDMRLQAFYQIEQNIEQFAVLADHIRLPLQVILGMADLADEEAMSAKLREQVERINAIVRQLDEGWVESRDIREFLRRNELV